MNRTCVSIRDWLHDIVVTGFRPKYVLNDSSIREGKGKAIYSEGLLSPGFNTSCQSPHIEHSVDFSL